MKIIKFEQLESTHSYLKNFITLNGYSSPTCVVTSLQTKGIGSRGNSWIGKKGNLFFSFVIEKKDLPNDLELQSASIYFSFLLKSIFNDYGSNVWLKWPNDFYIEDKKIGGTITTVTKDLVYCGIGINLKEVSTDYGKLDININIEETLDKYFKSLKNKLLWKVIFKSFKVEFQDSKNFSATVDNRKNSLKNAILNYDGSIQLNEKKVFSSR